MVVVPTVLSLLGVVAYIAVTIAIAAAVTWTVVRLSPAKKPESSSSGRS